MDFVFQSKNIGIFFERYLKSQFMSIQIKSVNFLTEILQPFQSIRPVSQLDFLLEIWVLAQARLCKDWGDVKMFKWKQSDLLRPL